VSTLPSGGVQPDDELARRVHETLDGYLALGNEVIDERLARFVRNPRAPQIYDANHVDRVRASTDDEIDRVLTRAEALFAHCTHRQFRVDPWTPEAFEARLGLEGYELNTSLELLLAGELRVHREPAAAEIRPVDSDDDWETLTRLVQLDNAEQAVREGRAPWTEALSRQMVETKRTKAPALRFFLASVDGTDCAYLSSWPGGNGLGQIEDLFTLRNLRHRGVGTALIRHCVDEARARGATEVVIASRMNDTPKHMYAAMGFRPFCVSRTYLKA
jgi:GNAT superfamily N-acetyltransferase